MTETRETRRVVVAFPSVGEGTPAWQEVLAVRARFDPLSAKVAPHLTLIFPFEDPISDGALEAHVRGAASQHRAFPVTLGEITAHENESLFLNVKRGNDALIALRDALQAGPLARHRVRRHTFVPHLTVGRVAPADLAAALEATADFAAVVDATIDAVSVYRIDADGTRPVLFRVPLGR